MTPCERLGYNVGAKFVVTEGDATFSSGSIISLFYDDGSENPLFKLVKGECNFYCAQGKKGAYINLSLIKPYIKTPSWAKFKIGDEVEKVKGSQWHGNIVGYYSTSLTPHGYAVESKFEKGSVQIYPEAALKSTDDEE